MGNDKKLISNHYFFYFAFAAAAILSVENWILGPLSWIYGYGSGLETIPALKALSYEHRNFSWWSPFVMGGIDRLAFWGNANPLGPEMFLFSFLPTWLANGIHRFLQYFIGIYFTSRVTNEQIKLNQYWSSLAGLLFGCFSYFTVGALFTLPGVPLMLWLLWRVVGLKGSYVKAIGSGLLLSCMTTFTFGVPYLLIFALLWLILIQRPTWSTAWVHFALFSMTLIFATSPQLFAIAINATDSHRANFPIEPFSWTLNALFYRQLQFDLFAQDKSLMALTMYLPWAMFLLGSAFAIFLWHKKDRQFAHNFARVGVMFAFLSQKWLWMLLQHTVSLFLPFVRGVYMGRFFEIPAAFLIALSLTLTLRMLWSCLKAYPVARIIQNTATSVLLLFMILKPKVHLFYALGVDDWGQANYQIPAVEALRRQNATPFRVASVAPLQPAYAYAQGLETVDGWANIYPAAYREFWLRVLSPLFKEIPKTQQIFGVNEGRDTDNFILLGTDMARPGDGLLADENINDALKTGFDIDRRFNLNLLRLLNTRYLLSEYPLKSTQIRLVHASDNWPTYPQYRNRNTGLVEEPRPPFIGNQYSILQPALAAYQAIQRKLRGKDVFIYEIVNSLERFHLINSISTEPNSQKVLDHLASSNEITLGSTATMEAKDVQHLRLKKHFSQGVITIKKYEADFIRLNVSSKGTGFLVIANSWSPYWRASIDGKKTPLLKVNYVQSGLPIPEGSHNIVLQYSPLSQWYEKKRARTSF